MCRHALLAGLFALMLGSVAPAQAQLFVRVTDAANPVVTEAFNSGGVTWFDAEGDGDLDLFVANGNLVAQRNSLFLNDGTGSFAVAPNAGDLTADSESSIGGAAGDVDGDGDLDLIVTNRTVSLNALYQNEGGFFSRVQTGAIATDQQDSNASAWVDIDLDGDLDLFVTNFDAANFLYRNTAGVLERADLPPLTSVVSPSINGNWADYDADGDLDYFMGNGGSVDDVLYRNDGMEVFSPVAFNDARATLGSSWGDYDNDSHLDLFVAYFLNAANGLYRNAGPPDFPLDPVSVEPVTTDLNSSTGSAWGDVDNDGDLDLFVANFGQDNALYLNTGAPDYGFEKLTGEAIATDGGSSFGAAFADYDEDGDLDLLVANQNGEVNFLYENVSGAGNWLQLDLVGRAPNTTALGARVVATATIGGDERVQVREVLAQTGYNSQSQRVHLGLAEAEVVTLQVLWPSGATTTLTDVAANQVLRVEEDMSTATEDGLPPGGVLRLYPNPVTEAATLIYFVETAGRVRVDLYDLLGRRVRTLVDELAQRGRHRVRWDARDDTGALLPTGTYLLVINRSGVRASRALTRVR